MRCSTLVAIAVFVVLVPRVHAAITIEFEEVGGNVSATASGTANTAALSGPAGIIINNGGFVRGSGFGSTRCGVAINASGAIGDTYRLSPTPLTDVCSTGGNFSVSSSSGDLVGFLSDTIPGDFVLYVPDGYISGDALSATATWSGQTFSSLGLTRGTYVYNWGSGATADSLTLIIPLASSFTVAATVASGSGTVSCSPTSVSQGDSSTCTAVPDSGFEVSAWTGDCASSGTSTTCSLSNIQADQSSSVSFAAVPPSNFLVGATVTGANGTVSCNPTSVVSGGSSTCTAVPDTGFEVSAWTGDCASSGTSTTCSLSNIQADQSSSVSFAAAADPSAPTPVPALPLWALMLVSAAAGALGLRYRSIT